MKFAINCFTLVEFDRWLLQQYGLIKDSLLALPSPHSNDTKFVEVVDLLRRHCYHFNEKDSSNSLPFL